MKLHLEGCLSLFFSLTELLCYCLIRAIAKYDSKNAWIFDRTFNIYQ
ncbi:hypothetical protein HMPREF9064_0915 [Aggregatibacter segnis ATCC 33393]|uniref:Uncharacterized protein n=1 Tax=Aggregatibacter segnis ATCC 33393 TaxID=888057 RepID=E6KXN3_9PAST|nr:hypothetical protein HMPREF9064_0915 [Aggregatibacter segnis ATCC 33393]